MTLLEAVRQMRAVAIKGAALLDDKEISFSPLACPEPHELPDIIEAGTRIRWMENGKLVIKRAAVTLHNTPAEMPDKAPTLWEDLPCKDGIRIIPDPITSGLKFSNGERGWWNGELYESQLDNNVWTPAGFPEGWKKVVQP